MVEMVERIVCWLLCNKARREQCPMSSPGEFEMTFGRRGTVNQLEVGKEANDLHSMKGLQLRSPILLS